MERFSEGKKAESEEAVGIPKSLELAKRLEETSDEASLRAELASLLDSISEELGIELTSDINSIYDGMRRDECLARVEKLSRVLETMELGKALHISDDDETHYANAVIPVPEGIKIAFAEGQAPGAIRAVVGFGKTIIGFKTDNISVKEIDFEEHSFRDQQERKYLCRHVDGDLEKNDIRYFLMRIPYHLMNEDKLTETEKDKKTQFIFRGARFKQDSDTG